MVAGNRILISGLDSLLDMLSKPATRQKTISVKLFYVLPDVHLLVHANTIFRTHPFAVKIQWRLPVNKKTRGGKRYFQYDQGLDACKYNYDLLLHYYHIRSNTYQ
jgi:hypothetical protein